MGLIALGNRSELGGARTLPSNRSRFQSELLLTLFCYSVLALSGCRKVELVTHDTGILAATPATVAFGNVTVGRASNATISIHAGSSGPVEITQLSLIGQGFAMSGQNDLPISIPSSGSYDLSLEFDPTATGAATGSLTVTSGSSSNGTVVIPTTGTGIAASYAVDLSWDAPTNSAEPLCNRESCFRPRSPRQSKPGAELLFQESLHWAVRRRA